MFASNLTVGVNSEWDDESFRTLGAWGCRSTRIGWDADWDIAQGWSGLVDICTRAKALGLTVDLEVVASSVSGVRRYDDPNVRRLLRWVSPATQVARLGLSSVSLLNEGNHKPFINFPNAAQWANTMVELRDLVRSINPALPVGTGGLSPESNELSWIPFLKAAYAANPRIKEFEAIGLHPYCFPWVPDVLEPWSGFTYMDTLDALFREWHGGAKTIPVWLTEFGAPTIRGESPSGAYTYSATGVRSGQAEWCAKYVKAMRRSRCTIAKVHWYRDRDSKPIGYTTTSNDPYMGLRYYDGTWKPAANVYSAFAWSKR